MTEMFVVFGDTGEYSDHSKWMVAVYPECEAAEMHARLANEALKAARLHESQCPSDPARGDTRPFRSAFHLDPDLSIDYTGTNYTVEAVPLVCHPDEFMDRFPPRAVALEGASTSSL